MQTPTQAPQGSPPPVTPSGAPPSAPAAVLRRRASRRLVAGVAGGLADYYRTRPIWCRLLFGGSALYAGGLVFGSLMDPYQRLGLPGHGMAAILSLIALATAAGYFLLWWLVPREDLAESAMQRLSRRYPSARRWPGIALLGLGLVFLLDRLSVWRADVVLAFALIAGGVLLYRRGDSQDARAPAAPAPMPTGPPLPPGSAAMIAFDDAVARVLPPRERSALGWTTFGITLLVVGCAVVWVTATDATPRLVSIPALALLVLSAGLLVGTVVGRARWLVLPALLLLPIVLVTSAVRLPLDGPFGVDDTFFHPATAAAVADSYRAAAGGISLDLTALQEQPGDVTLSASTVFGDVQVVVPYDAHVVAEGYTGFGNVSLIDAGDDGLEAAANTTSEPRWGDGMTIHLVLESGIGSVSVYRDYPTPHELRQLRRERRADEAAA